MSEPATMPRLLRFGAFEADLKTGELRKHGLKLKLQIQPFRILAMLMERPGELITREEIREALWPADTFIDFEHSVNSSIKKLREVLSDDAEKPRYIETLPRRGYRFIAPVETAQQRGDQFIASVETARRAVSTSAPVSPATTPAAGMSPAQQVGAVREPPRRMGWVIALAACAVVASLAVMLALDVAGIRDRLMNSVGTRHGVPLPKIESLAVLPLENLSHDPEQEYFADGMTDELITTLAKIRSLRIISRTSAMRYKGTKKPLPQIARELNVDALVEGSVLRSGNRVRITAKVIYAPTDRHLWAQTYESDLQDVLVLQGEVARAIAEGVRVELTPQQESHLTSTRAVNPEAYVAYLKGRHFWNEINPFKAAEYFGQAAQLDPTYAPAYGGLALSYTILGYFQPPSEVVPKGKAAAEKALALDPGLAEAHTALGIAKLNFDWDWAGAEREFKRAIELNPGSPDAHLMYALYLSIMSRFDEGLREARRGVELDPLSPLAIGEVAFVLMNARRYDEAIAQNQKVLELEPGSGAARFQIYSGYIYKGMYPEALTESRRWGDQGSPYLAYLYAMAGKKKAALKIVENLEREARRGHVDPYNMAIAYAGLGDKDHAFAALEKCYGERNASMPQMKTEAFFDPIRSDPRFQDLLRRMNFPP